MIDSRAAKSETHGVQATYASALKSADRAMLERPISAHSLDPRVGLMRFDIVQPMDLGLFAKIYETLNLCR